MAVIAASYRLTEEIARWTFETYLNNASGWWIAFTNPTAGPWKRLLGRNDNGLGGEVYRFARDEDRPDIVAVNDDSEEILILEAKDSGTKLAAAEQVQKSAGVVTSLAAILAQRGDCPFWGKRSRYAVVAGLLWGTTLGTRRVEPATLFRNYRPKLAGVALVGIEIEQDEHGELRVREHADESSLGTSRVFFARGARRA